MIDPKSHPSREALQAYGLMLETVSEVIRFTVARIRVIDATRPSMVEPVAVSVYAALATAFAGLVEPTIAACSQGDPESREYLQGMADEAARQGIRVIHECGFDVSG